MGANFSGFNGFVLSMVGDVPVDSEAPMMTSLISRMDLPTQYSKMLIGFTAILLQPYQVSAYGDFINLQDDLLAQSSKMLIGLLLLKRRAWQLQQRRQQSCMEEVVDIDEHDEEAIVYRTGDGVRSRLRRKVREVRFDAVDLATSK
ncbi:hypothetical protein [Oryza sativa Japonica Group]|uniref:Uncharacterized protein n=1 Tax=Oryza sativa subsp. japonica TaxID=39947 RepID=Q5NAW0_ORYSJ|nr:hypothetical protein [Oryza sativa Japonica Group]